MDRQHQEPTAPEPSDDQLISSALDGSVQAWDALVRRHEARVYNYALRLTGNRDDALDLLQDVFLGVYRKLDRFRGESQFVSWLFRIAHNKAVDMARRRRANPVQQMQQALAAGDEREPDDWPDHRDGASSPHQELLTSEVNVRIHALLQCLKPAQREMLELKIFQSLTFDEIAETLEISANTAKTRFYAALKRLRELMEGHDELSPDP